jgi:hypothetical protein
MAVESEAITICLFKLKVRELLENAVSDNNKRITFIANVIGLIV